MLTLKKLFFKKLYEKEILHILSLSEQNYIKFDKAILTPTITLKWLIYNRNFVSKNIIKNLKSNIFTPPLAIEKTVNIEGKNRKLYFFDWHIRVLHGVITKILTKELENILPDQVVAYRKGRNIYNVVSEASEQMKFEFDNKNMNNFVIRKDVKSYGDSINIKILCDLVKKYINMDDSFYDLICKNLNFKYISEEDGKIYIKKTGLPTGSPLNTVFTNLYLIELDNYLIKQDVFYRRYVDDIILVGQNVNLLEKTIDDYRSKLKLKFNDKKEGWVDLKGTFFRRFSAQMIRYLGFMINSNGHIYPTIEKDLKIKEFLNHAIRTAYISLRKEMKNKEFQIEILINSVKISVDKTKLKDYLFQIIGITSKEYFKSLDIWLAKQILKHVFHKSSDKVFSKYPFKKLRSKGLISFQHIQILYLFNKKGLKRYLEVEI